MANEVRELKSIDFKKLKGLKDVTIDFGDADHRITGIFGLNGSGKTTILHTVMCVYSQAHNNKIPVPADYKADTHMSRYFKHVGGQYWQNSDYSVTFMYETTSDKGDKIYKVEQDKKAYKKYFHPVSGRKTRSEWTPRERSKQKRCVYYIPLKSCMPDIEEIQTSNATIDTTTAVDINRAQKICLAASQIMGKSYEAVDKVGTYFLKHKCYHVRTAEAGDYHSLSMGAGEQRLFRILEVLYNAPDKSLIVIDEIDLTLHTAALRTLFELMSRIVKEKKLQVVFTSHRQEIMDFKNVNVRFIINTPTKTYCVDNPTAQCYEQLSGELNKHLNIYVEDETSKCIVEKVLMQHKLKNRAHVRIYGAVQNAIPLACAFEIQQSLDGGNRKNILFVLDGDKYVTDEEKMDQINKALSGNGDEVEQRRRNVFKMLTQYKSQDSKIQTNKKMCPEEFIYNALKELPENNQNPEIVDAAKRIGTVTDPHDYFKILEENYNINEIISVFKSNSARWEEYTSLINEWAEDRYQNFSADRIE